MNEKGLIKLLNGNLIRATLELKKDKDISGKEYLDKIYEEVHSLGYQFTGILRDVKDENIYHISIAKEDVC